MKVAVKLLINPLLAMKSLFYLIHVRTFQLSCRCLEGLGPDMALEWFEGREVVREGQECQMSTPDMIGISQVLY